MRACTLAHAVCVALAGSLAYAHGPQIQITIDDNKIVARQLLLDGPYSGSLTAPKSVYVMPVREIGGVLYAQPNNAPSATIPGAPEYLSGPGFAYGYDLADGGPQEFEAGSILSLTFADELNRWDGAAFDDAGATELKAFRGANPNITTPAANFAVTSDGGPLDSVSLSAVATNYGSEGTEVHNTIRYALLGDGSNPLSTSPNGIYLLSLRLSSTQDGLVPSEEFLFVLPKNVPYATVVTAVDSLGYAPGAVQWLIPEPGSLALLSVGAIGLAVARRRQQRKRKCG